MPPPRSLSPQSVWDSEALLAAFAQAGVKQLHAATLWSHLLKAPAPTATAWEDLPASLPAAAAAVLRQRFSPLTSRPVQVQRSAEGDTTKLLLELQDGLKVEAVVMHYDTSGRYAGDPATQDWGGQRSTLCVSSQVGCAMGCEFCATGTMGLKANLTAGEIAEQLVHALRLGPVRNVVFMGMGEPLHNYAPVVSAIRLMTDRAAFGLSRRHVTLSTVGVIPRLLQLPTDLPGVSLALSLHAPSQELRARIVPSARAYPLTRLMDAVAAYQAATGQRVFVEYVMLSGVNDGLEAAHQLGALLAQLDVTVNLIPWNPVYSPAGRSFNAPQRAHIDAFRAVLRAPPYSLPCTVRAEKGRDISGACGQLVVSAAQAAEGLRQGQKPQRPTGKCGGAAALADIEDMVGGAAPAAGAAAALLPQAGGVPSSRSGAGGAGVGCRQS